MTDDQQSAALQAWLDTHPVKATDHDRRIVEGGDDPEVWARSGDVDPGGRRADEAADRYETWLGSEQW